MDTPGEALNRQRHLCLSLAKELCDATLQYKRLEERSTGKLSCITEKEFLQMVYEKEVGPPCRDTGDLKNVVAEVLEDMRCGRI